MKKRRNYKEYLFKRLQDPKAAAAYLSAVETEDPKVFLIALKDVMESKTRKPSHPGLILEEHFIIWTHS